MTSINDVPADLLRTIAHAFKILEWYEHLTKDEIPPEWMWAFDEELNEWFEEVRAAREEKYGGGSSSKDDDEEEVPLMSNELARGRR